MRITLTTREDILGHEKLIAEKQKEGYMLINKIEGMDTVSNEFGNHSIPSLILEFQKF